MGAGVIAAVEGSGVVPFGIYVCVDVNHSRIAGSDRYFGAPYALRQAGSQLRPARASVARLEDSASRHLERGTDLPGRLTSRPKGRIHDVRVVGIDDDVESADVLVLI